MTEKRDADERITLAPLDPEEALRALLAVKLENADVAPAAEAETGAPEHG